MGFFGGYRTFGLSDEEIGRVGSRARRSGIEASRQSFSDAMRRLAQSNAMAGLGSSGFTAGAAPGIFGREQANLMQQDASIQEMMANLRNSRTHVYQEGLGQTLLGGLMGIGGQVAGGFLAGRRW